MNNPYETCPTFGTENFVLRLVSEEDSESLIECYSDRIAQKFFNADKCSGDFCMHTIEDMTLCIRAWLWAFSEQEFIRFAVVDRARSKAIGTVEMFGYIGKSRNRTGILRVDLSSRYENAGCLYEIFNLCAENFFDLFDVDTIATKAIPLALSRRSTLQKLNFYEGATYEGEHYFLRSK